MLAMHALIGLAMILPAAAHDNNVEWSGVSHLDAFDRRPVCPVDGEAFTVFFQTYDFDITSARVHFDDGGQRWIDAAYAFDRGVYDVWRATLPCTDPQAVVEYYIELTDGGETDYLGPAGMSATPPANGWVIDYATLLHAPLGATPISDGGAVFKVWAAGASSAAVAGTFNGWNLAAHPMTASGEYFTVRIDDVDLNAEYKYVFNGTHWKPDARGRRLNPANGNYNTYVQSPLTHDWQSPADFAVPPFEEMIIYQLHVGTYAGRNDGNNFGSGPATYRAVVDSHRAHLVDLGINVVQLMPITEFPTDWSGGYNPITQFAPEWGHGTPDDLKYLVDQFHQVGIAVTLDVVWNHFSGSDNFLWEYTGSGATGQIYFDGDGATGQFETPWGAQADFDRGPVHDYFADSARYWLDEFRLDGYRVDGTDFMNPPNGQPSGWGLMQRINNETDRRAVDKIIYAEQLPDDYYVTRPTAQGGAGFDAQYHDRYKYAMRDAIFAAAAGTGSANITELRNCLYGDLNDGTNIVSVGQSRAQLIHYFQLHDEAWPESGGQRMVRTIDPTFPHDSEWARGRMLYGLGVTMFAPGIPALFMGDEFLEDTDFDTDAAHRIDWSKPTTYANYLLAVKDMIRVRNQNGALRANAGMEINHLNESVDIFTMHRWDGVGNDLLVVASLANEDRNNYRVGFPQGGVWHEIYNSQAGVYGGNGSGNGGSVTPTLGSYDGYGQSALITVPRMSVSVFRSQTCTNAGQCDDGVACTADACVQGACVHTPDDGACPDDGNFCNGTEYCNPLAGCVSTGYPCDTRFCDESADVCATSSVDPAPAPADLANCLFGPAVEPMPIVGALCTASCLDRFDLDFDNDVDLMDFSLFQPITTAEYTEYLGDATAWKGRFSNEAAYAFDSFYPGIAGSGAISGPSVTLNLGSLTLTITDTTSAGALWDNSTSGGQLSDAAIHLGGRSVWEFSQPIYGLYTYYASLAGGNVAQLTLYNGATQLASFSRDNGGSATLASGHGFTSTVGVTRVEFEHVGTDNRVLLGAATGLAAGESSLGTIVIPGYAGPSGSTVQLDFAIATTRPTP